MAARRRKKESFKLSHSLGGALILISLEAFAITIAPAIGDWIVDLCSVVGSIAALYIATEVIEEVKSPRHMLQMLSVIVGEFVGFFAFQYFFLISVAPNSFPTLPPEPVALLLNSVMVFVFNPLWVPATTDGQVLLFINTLSALGLVLFVLQNVWQFRKA